MPSDISFDSDANSFFISFLFGVFLGEKDRAALKFSDPKVCKSFLLECCPHEILASTVSVKIFDEHFDFLFHQLCFISFTINHFNDILCTVLSLKSQHSTNTSIECNIHNNSSAYPFSMRNCGIFHF